jgi:hypothetical protein
MEKIVVGFSRHKGFAPLSWLIMAVERTPFSHVYLSFYSNSLDRRLIYHATGSGVHFISQQRFEAKNVVVSFSELPISAEGKTAMLRWCVDQAGKPYGKLQIVGLGLKRLAAFFGFKIKNPFPNGEYADVCSEAVVRALMAAGYKIPDQDDLDSMGLVETAKLIQNKVQETSQG